MESTLCCKEDSPLAFELDLGMGEVVPGETAHEAPDDDSKNPLSNQIAT
jgi:hypothetical protein